MAADCDPEAVQMAAYNVVENKLADQINILVSQGFDHPDLHQLFDIIAANILAQPLIHLSQQMAQFTNDHGHIVLSGLLKTQQDQVTKAYERYGFALIETYPQDEWTTLVMRKERFMP